MKAHTRVLEITETRGTSDFAITGITETGREAFTDVFDTYEAFNYVACLFSPDGTESGEWEEGLGYVNGDGDLQRVQVFRSSDGATKVDFSAGGTLKVFVGGSAQFRSGVVVESSDTITLDLARAATHTRAVAGSVTIDATNYAPGLGCALVLTNDSGSTQTVTSSIVGATWLTGEPVDLEDGEIGYLTGVSTTSAASGLVLAWVVVIP